jgi:exopolysaccharide/PEP-CTERM locus tyrosine autokinase
MSLVEKALEKLQRKTRLHASAAQGGSVVGASVMRNAAERSRARNSPSTRIVHIDRVELRAAGLLPPEHQERQISDQYRQIKRPLIGAANAAGAVAGSDSALIMVTSALAGDGKTFTSVNLAMSLAKERDFDVVLVDGDVAKPHISRVLGLQDDKGLLDVLREESMELESLVLPTDIPGLSVLPAGRHSDAATELLSSQRMKSVAQQLQGTDVRRMVVIDSPPLLLTNESRVLAGSVGQVVVVVRSGKTSQQNLLDALSYLDATKQAIGLVLNQTLNNSAEHNYEYGADSIQGMPNS